MQYLQERRDQHGQPWSSCYDLSTHWHPRSTPASNSHLFLRNRHTIHDVRPFTFTDDGAVPDWLSPSKGEGSRTTMNLRIADLGAFLDLMSLRLGLSFAEAREGPISALVYRGDVRKCSSNHRVQLTIRRRFLRNYWTSLADVQSDQVNVYTKSLSKDSIRSQEKREKIPPHRGLGSRVLYLCDCCNTPMPVPEARLGGSSG